MVRRQAEPLQPLEINGGAESCLQPVEDPTPSVPAEGFWGKPVLEQFVSERANPAEGNHAGWGSFVRMFQQGRTTRNFVPEEEEAAEKIANHKYPSFLDISYSFHLSVC